MKMLNSLMALASAACMVAFTGCGEKAAEKAPEAAQAPVAKKVLKMATEATFPPYEYMENGEFKGIDVEIVGTIAKELGYKLEVVDMKFDSVILSVQTAKCDVAASGITVTEERKKQINFTIPYVTAAQVIVVPEKSAIKTPADLKDAKIRLGVQQGTTGDTYVTQKLHQPERFDNAGMAVAALVAGKLDAVVCDNEPAKVHVTKNAGLRILPVALTEEEYAFAIAKENTELLDGFNKVLRQMYKDGRLQAILDKFLNAPENK